MFVVNELCVRFYNPSLSTILNVIKNITAVRWNYCSYGTFIDWWYVLDACIVQMLSTIDVIWRCMVRFLIYDNWYMAKNLGNNSQNAFNLTGEDIEDWLADSIFSHKLTKRLIKKKRNFWQISAKKICTLYNMVDQTTDSAESCFKVNSRQR